MISLFFYIGNCSTTSVSDSEGSDSDSDIGQQAKVIMVSKHPREGFTHFNLVIQGFLGGGGEGVPG